MTDLTDREILESCARACGVMLRWNYIGTQDARSPKFDPLEDDGDCARMENVCGVIIDFNRGRIIKFTQEIAYREDFTPGNDEQRRHASCLVVARAQLAKEKTR